MGFEAFVRSQTRPLLGLATAMSGDPALAEDLVQDVLLKIHGRWERIAALDDPPSYVRRMLVNEYLSWRRKWSRVLPVASPDPSWELDDAPDHATTYADRTVLAAQIRRLTRRQRTVLALRFYGGLDDREIAETLGCSESSVRSHASRALAALRAHAGRRACKWLRRQPAPSDSAAS
jgi:RNA polymerase sigma-70 factor (sigma-E family)